MPAANLRQERALGKLPGVIKPCSLATVPVFQLFHDKFTGDSSAKISLLHELLSA